MRKANPIETTIREILVIFFRRSGPKIPFSKNNPRKPPITTAKTTAIGNRPPVSPMDDSRTRAITAPKATISECAKLTRPVTPNIRESPIEAKATRSPTFSPLTIRLSSRSQVGGISRMVFCSSL